MGASWEQAPPALGLGEGELHVWRAGLAVDAETRRRLAAALSRDELERAARFVFARDRDRFVAARGALRQILGGYLGAPPGALRFRYGPRGKPELAGPPEHGRLGFNLAHSGELALVAVAWGRRVGVDLELVRDELDYAPLLPDIFSAGERRALAALPAPAQRLAFFGGWARKEAYLKARGDGLTHPPNQVEVGLAPGAQAPLQLPPAEPGEKPWTLYTLDAGPGYAAAVVGEGDPVHVRTLAFPYRSANDREA